MENVRVCYDCYDNMEFQVYGQSEDFNPKKVAKKYVAKLNKPIQEVTCELCERKLTYEYDETKNFWNTLIND